MDSNLLYDVIRRQNIQSAVDDATKDGDYPFYDPAKYEDYEEDIPTKATRFAM
jgi:hypothetical protein